MGGMDTKRTLIMIALLATIWIVWMRFFMPKPPPQPAQQPPPQAPATQTQAPSAPEGAPAAATTPAPPGAQKEPGAAAPTSSRPPEEKVTLESKRWKATFSSYGAALTSFELLDPQYREHVGATEVPVDLVKTPGQPALATTFDDSSFQVPPDAAWQVDRRGADAVAFVWQGAGVRVSKEFKVEPAGAHTLTLAVAITNTGEKPVVTHVQLRSYSRHDFTEKSGFGRPAPNLWMPACYVDGKVRKKGFEELRDKGALSATGDTRWVGVTDRYFMLAVAPMPDPAHGPRTCSGEVVDSRAGLFQAALLLPEQRIEPGRSQSESFVVFAGPKILNELDAVKPGGQKSDLGDSVDYGWLSPISRVMLLVLVGVRRVIGSWGVAIIALTLLVKLLTYPLTQKSMKSAKEMAKLKPKIEALQKRYKDDKQRLNQEMMGLYKSHGVNPLGGCLPMLIQLPIWWALYATLGNAVELYRSKFLWMPDLTRADPYYITPIAMGIFMFLQQRITPMPTDSEQQKMMMYMMPVVFTVMSLWFPAGLTVYILTNTLLTMVQQWWMNRAGGEKVLKAARA